MSIPKNITKEHLIKAIEKIDSEGIPSNVESRYYDVIYNTNKYPPKLVISYANLFANGEALDRKTFSGGLNTQCFKILTENGFVIEKKVDNINDKPSFWIEKSIVIGRKDRQTGERALGKALWSTQKDRRGADIYKNMRLVKKGDLILHLINKGNISGVSIARDKVIDTNGLAGTGWEGKGYLVELDNYTELISPIERSDLLNETNKSVLLKIASNSEVFYNKKLDLRQGAYLTPCPLDLLILINKSYVKITGLNLPYVEEFLHNSNKELNIELDLNQIFTDLADSGLQIHNSLIIRFIASVVTKPFVILTGLSGSGKTKLAQAFVQWICQSSEQYRIIPVGADWTNREPLLGFPNGLTNDQYVMPDSGALKILMEAGKVENQNKPYFIVLDEMNLSHVERYFADFLSVMESGKSISLYDGVDRKNSNTPIPKEVGWPSNLFIIGTVNIDETTYMFSPKVLDRANVIEFRVSQDEMADYLQGAKHLDMKKLYVDDNENKPGKGAEMARDFLRLSREKISSDKAKESLGKFFPILQKAGAEFGYRTAFEINMLVGMLETLRVDVNEEENVVLTDNDLIDFAVMQKLLPKLHGSRTRLVPVLVSLGRLCITSESTAENFTDKDDRQFIKEYFDSDPPGEKIKYKISIDKLRRMYRNVIANGFTSYAEA